MHPSFAELRWVKQPFWETFLLKNAQADSNQEKAADKPKSKDILQNNWQHASEVKEKERKVMKEKERHAKELSPIRRE